MKFRRRLIFLALLLCARVAAQIEHPVQFEFGLKSLENNLYEASLKADLEPGWHIYSKDIPEDSGIPTVFKLSSQNVDLVGEMQELGEKHDEYSEVFRTRIVSYLGSVVFKQAFRLKNGENSQKISAEITYQVCNDRICLAPETLEFEEQLSLPGEKLSPDSKLTSVVERPATGLEGMAQVQKVESLDYKHPLTECGGSLPISREGSGLGLIFLLGFLGGIVALLTPCVFPMIPLTVSFFTKGLENGASGRRKALLYAFFILFIFVVLSLPFYVIEGISGNIFNDISTNVWLNLFFFIVFVFFALSFFGYYEIRLPSSVINRSSKAEETGGILGVFFMALTLVIVSFSCTGPILGGLLGSVATGLGDVPLMLTSALGGFGLSWALVFGLLALFPQSLQALPRSGTWMNTLKVVLGFVELALALKFLSKADLVSKTFLLKREIFVGLWVLITLGLVLYLLGLIRFPNDGQKSKVSIGRKSLACLGLCFVVYLSQGFFPSGNTKLRSLSGILPPINVSLFAEREDEILGIRPLHDYFSALEVAKLQNKPLLIDFTGYGCENCRKMEEYVWSEPDILPLLQDEVILVSLYVDDKEDLKEGQTYVYTATGKNKLIKTIGDKWSFFQQVNFNNNSQPHYALVTPDGKMINRPISGYVSGDDFRSFLRCGLDYYRERKG